MNVSLSLNLILDRIAYDKYEGELGVRSIFGVASIADAIEGELTFVSSNKFAEELSKSNASVVILGENIEATPRGGQLFLRVENPSIEVAKICEIIAEQMWLRPEPGISRNASVSSQASVDESATIGPFVTIEEGAVIEADCVIGSGSFIGKECRLGEGCHLSANVTLERDTHIGKRVRIHSNAVLGSDGFGYEFQDGAHKKIPQVGSVLVGDDVEIGSNTSIDRGRLGPTRIGEGTKIDNLVQIGHNTVMGKHCMICAQVGIAGSTTLGDYVVMGGRAGASGHIKIGQGAQLAGQCVAFSDLEAGGKYGGAPAVSLVAYQRMTVLQRRLPDISKRLKRIESQILEEK